MKQLKFAIAGLGALGFLGIFLPLVSERGASISMWQMSKLMGGSIHWVLIVGFALAIAGGVLAITKKALTPPFAGMAIAGFGLALFKLQTGIKEAPISQLLKHGSIGAYMMIFGAIAGLVVSILGIVKGEKA